MNKFSVLSDAPEFTKGFVKELRVRWAHEELGLPYSEIKMPHAQTKLDEYMKSQPFGQVPYFESGDLSMFETGAILLHLATKHNKLIPKEEIPKAKTLSWLFASLNSVEPYIGQYFLIKSFYKCEDKETVKKSYELVHKKLSDLSKALGQKSYFQDEFSIADIVMTTVLRDAYSQELLSDFPNLVQYVKRNEARPAFAKALKDHERLYTNNK